MAHPHWTIALLSAFLVILPALVAPALAGESEVPVTVVVPDAPTDLRLLNDTVNADNKTKSPGDALITRVAVSDENGLDDVETLTFTYARVSPDGARVRVHERVLRDLDGGNATVTSATVEDRFAHAPLKAGPHVAVVTARDRAGNETRVERTFIIRDLQPTLSRWGFGEASHEAGRAIAGLAGVGDANFGAAPLDPEPAQGFGSLTLKVFRGTTLVGSDWRVQLGSVATTGGAVSLDVRNVTSDDAGVTQEDGLGVLNVTTRVTPPLDAAAGQYRFALYHTPPAGGTAALLGSRYVTLENATRLVALSVGPVPLPRDGALRLNVSVSVSGEGHVEARIVRANGSDWVAVEGTAVAAAALSELPSNGTLAYLEHTWTEAGNLTLGPDYGVKVTLTVPDRAPDVRVSRWAFANAAPTLHVAPCDSPTATGPVTAAPGTPVAFCAEASDADGDTFSPVAFDLVNWEGVSVIGQGASLAADKGQPGRVTLTVNETLPRGRYTLTASTMDAGGASAAASFAVDVGAWAGLELAESRLTLAKGASAGRLEGRVTLTNRGEQPVERLTLTAPLARSATGAIALDGATVRLLSGDGAVLALATVRNGEAVLSATSGPVLSGRGTVTLAIDYAVPAGTDAGEYGAQVRLLAHLG